MTIARTPNTTDPVLAFDLRDETRTARRLAHLAAQGYTHSRCNRCHDIRTLSWEGGECNNWDGDTEDQMCGGIYRPAGQHA